MCGLWVGYEKYFNFFYGGKPTKFVTRFSFCHSFLSTTIRGLNSWKRAFRAVFERFPYQVDQLRFHERVCIEECDGAWGERHCLIGEGFVGGPECRFGSTICTRHHLSLRNNGSSGAGRVEVHNYSWGLSELKKTGSTFLKKSGGLAKKKAPSFFGCLHAIKKESYFFQFLKRIRVLNFYKEKCNNFFLVLPRKKKTIYIFFSSTFNKGGAKENRTIFFSVCWHYSRKRKKTANTFFQFHL